MLSYQAMGFRQRGQCDPGHDSEYSWRMGSTSVTVWSPTSMGCLLSTGKATTGSCSVQ